MGKCHLMKAGYPQLLAPLATKNGVPAPVPVPFLAAPEAAMSPIDAHLMIATNTFVVSPLRVQFSTPDVRLR